tara:strand:- start:1821 stop:2585 length:765 start_codon:yes stop_codon:yes gene_type:complete
MPAKQNKKEIKIQKSPFGELAFLTVLLIIYYAVRFFLADKFSIRNPNMGKIVTTVMVLIMVISQITTSISLSKSHCNGVPQIGSAFLHTLIPNVLYMGPIIALLMFFPGFKAPFSNTFGYLAISPWVKSSINEILVGDSEKSNSLLKKICQDESILVNLLTPSEQGFTQRLENLTKDSDGLRTDWQGTKAEATLYNLVVIKDMIGEFFWIILGLAISISTTFNGITAIENCAKGGVMEDAMKSAKSSKLLKSIQ